ncbi:MAG TPA: hypothetical protein VD737_07740 [Steroidobacteraceae bacterium]|nr:hypothetical protein [Steroidobacteraceae bacterium]
MKHAPACRRLLAVIASGTLLGTVALADPPADKGKSAGAAQSVKVDGKSSSAAQDRRRDDGQGKADDNHGQVVSDCNHRANQKELKGKDRQDYVEWCTDRGERHQYDDRRYDQDRSCYRKAAEKGLSGDSRRAYIQDCLRKQEKNR